MTALMSTVVSRVNRAVRPSKNTRTIMATMVNGTI